MNIQRAFRIPFLHTLFACRHKRNFDPSPVSKLVLMSLWVSCLLINCGRNCHPPTRILSHVNDNTIYLSGSHNCHAIPSCSLSLRPPLAWPLCALVEDDRHGHIHSVCEGEGMADYASLIGGHSQLDCTPAEGCNIHAIPRLVKSYDLPDQFLYYFHGMKGGRSYVYVENSTPARVGHEV